jgi:ABC-type dipeptide/oligopeptide/nickel transport system permease subunit
MGGAAIVRRLLGVLMPRRVLLGVAVVVVGAAVTFGVVLGMVADALF